MTMFVKVVKRVKVNELLQNSTSASANDYGRLSVLCLLLLLSTASLM